jgi:hypothetical protein
MDRLLAAMGLLDDALPGHALSSGGKKRTPSRLTTSRVLNFGFLANRKRATLLHLCFQLLGSVQQPQAEQHASSPEDFPDSWRCPKCGGAIKVIGRLTAAEIQLRSPPPISAAA